ncbi:MAG TPA: cytochrome c [Rhizomicrobium sp.]|nr:cytochrome c [Rhizomicrobium sp.]
MRKRVLISIITLATLGIVGFGALAWRPAIAPIATPARAAFAPELIAKGAALAAGGYCAECHTAKDGQELAGGYAMATPFGVLYSTNITPDTDTGIGTWSEAAFARAMQDGVARDGSLLFPAFPYDHFTKLSDADVHALYAFFMTRAPVRAPAHKNGLPFPLNVRYLQAGWRLLFFRPGRFERNPSKSAEWNRGAYLAEGLSHCGACHTPRNLLGAEKNGDAYAGAGVDNWIAPPLTTANPDPVPWTERELVAYLRTGASDLHGSAAGPMAPVVHGLAALAPSDVQSLALYFADLDHAAERASSTTPAVARAMSYAPLGTGQETDPDARLYMAACASCHYNAGAPVAVRPDLALNNALNLPDPSNFIEVVLHGIDAEDGIPGVVMPSFGRALSDSDIARIAAYLRRTRTPLPPWPDLDQRISALRAKTEASEP